MNLLGPIKSIMSTNLKTLPPSATIADAAKIFEDSRIHHIPIILEGELIGMLSMSDYLFFRRGFLDDKEDQKVEQIRLNNYTVSYIMTEGLAIMEEDEKINVAVEIFKENIFKAIPIKNNAGDLVGIVTTHDIIKNLAKDNGAYAKYE